MGKRIYPLKSIKYWWSYTIEEICELYKSYSLHPQTVRTWIKSGLPVMNGRPVLIYGNDLKVFLGKMNTSNKCCTEFNQMYCMRCKDAKSFYKKQIKVEIVNRVIKAKALCRDCRSIMNKPYKLEGFPKIRKLFHVVDVLELYDNKDAPLKTHFAAPEETPSNEPIQSRLF